MQAHVSTRSRKRRGALQAGELLVVLPVLGLIGMGIFQFGVFFMQQQRLQSAVDASCRVAARPYPTIDKRVERAEEAFYETLGNVPWADDCKLQVEFSRELDGSVRVSVEVPAKLVLPDLLGWVGLGHKKEDRLAAAAVMPLL